MSCRLWKGEEDGCACMCGKRDVGVILHTHTDNNRERRVKKKKKMEYRPIGVTDLPA